MPSSSILSTLPKLGTCDVHHWRKNIEGYIKACGLGLYIRASVPAPTNLDDIDRFEMRRQQVMLAIRATLDEAHMQHISGLNNPFVAIQSLEKRHSVKSGLAAANIIQIVNHCYDSSTKLEGYVSSAQSLQNQLAKTTSADSKLKLSDEVLALLLLINLPREDFGGIIQQLLGDINNLSTSNVINCLLTEAQMNSTESALTIAYTVVAKAKKPEKKPALGKGGNRSSNSPDALCSHPGHHFSMHLNRNCKAKKNDQLVSNSRPMQRQWSAPVSHLNSKPTQLFNADKFRLFDQAFSTRAVQSKPNAATNVAIALNEETESVDDEIIKLTTAYSTFATDTINKADFFMDTGSNKDIFNDVNVFSSLHNIQPVTIKSANGGQMTATQAGSVVVTTFNLDNVKCITTLSDALYCPEVEVNLISATKLSDLGYVMNGDAWSMCFSHEDGSKIFACRNASSMDLWKARVSTDYPLPSNLSPPTKNVSFRRKGTFKAYNAAADLTHQRMAHLHSAALRKFCGSGDHMSEK